MVTITYFSAILIHTSVKLVTHNYAKQGDLILILIHTSVKLVTKTSRPLQTAELILIHTSVKLVTGLCQCPRG